MRLHPAGAASDALAGAAWECRRCPPGAVEDPEGIGVEDGSWMPATVPGTAAGTLRDRGEWRWGDDDEQLLDGSDWWYRCFFAASDGGEDGVWELELGGLATIADVWLNGEHVLHSENMWLSHRIPVPPLGPTNALVVRCAALDPFLARRRPRPRWRSLVLRSQNLRWFRTTLLGRMPGWAPSGAPVGPWRPVRLHRLDGSVSVREHRLATRVEGDEGVLDARLVLDGVAAGTAAEVWLGDRVEAAVVRDEDGSAVVEVELRAPHVERWWPHTHGGQPLHRVRLVIGGDAVDVADVGFRAVRVDRDDSGFAVWVNDVPVFCRGANWSPPDAVSLAPGPGRVRQSLGAMVEAGMNMVRLPGYSVYEDGEFWDACDELGILVWQDCMIAGIDPPEDPDFGEGLEAELVQQLGALLGHPSLAVVCGSSDSQQQAAMFGLPADRRHSAVLEEAVPAVVERVLPGVPYLPSAPTGGDLPFDPAVGVASYFGVGGYLRPLSDARSAGVRFAAECLAFATPPEPSSVEAAFGTSAVAGHAPAWKAGVPRDSSTSWDHDDIRDRYVGEIFGLDPFQVRYADPERALDFGRAAVAQAMSTVLTEWRCRRSACAGALVLNWQDVGAGAGWGLLDASGAPKAPWFALRRVLAPVELLLTDDGLSGLGVHVVNDRPDPARGTLRMTLYDLAGTAIDEAVTPVEVAGRSQRQWSTAALFDGFRDLTNAYRFGPPAYDVVRVRLEIDGADGIGGTVGWGREAVFLPGGHGRPLEPDLGLEASATGDGGRWQVNLATRRFAQWVALDVPGYRPDDSWFHLPPGAERTVVLHPTGADGPPKGRVRALNGLRSVPIVVHS